MQIADCWLYLDKRRSDVPLRGVTPAELVILVRKHRDSVGAHPVHDLVILPGVAMEIPSPDEQAARDSVDTLRAQEEQDRVPEDQMTPPNDELRPRTNAQERARLQGRFGYVTGSKPLRFWVDEVYPGENAKLPETFEETGHLAASRPAEKAA